MVLGVCVCVCSIIYIYIIYMGRCVRAVVVLVAWPELNVYKDTRLLRIEQTGKLNCLISYLIQSILLKLKEKLLLMLLYIINSNNTQFDSEFKILFDWFGLIEFFFLLMMMFFSVFIFQFIIIEQEKQNYVIYNMYIIYNTVKVWMLNNNGTNVCGTL